MRALRRPRKRNGRGREHVSRMDTGRRQYMNQGYIAPSAQPAAASPGVPPSGSGGGRRHTLSAESLLFLAELYAREQGAELAAAHAVTPEGERIDLLRPARRRTVFPPTAVRGC